MLFVRPPPVQYIPCVIFVFLRFTVFKFLSYLVTCNKVAEIINSVQTYVPEHNWQRSQAIEII